MDLSRSICLRTSASSSRIFCRSRPVSRCSRMSRMALDWIWDRPNCVIKPSRASTGDLEARMSSMTASRWSRAIRRPSRMWARASAFRSSYSVRRRTTSRRNSMKFSHRSTSGRTNGRPSTRASVMIPNVVCSGVCLNRLFRTTSGIRIALELDDDPQAVPVRLVAQVRDALDRLVANQFGDLLDQLRLVDLVRNLGDDDRPAVAACRLLDLGLRADDERAAARSGRPARCPIGRQ